MARKKTTFSGAPLPSPPPKGPIHEFTHTDKRGRSWTWKFAKVGIATIADQLAEHLGPKLHEEFVGKAASNLQDHDYAWRALGRRLRSENGDGDFGLSVLTDADIDACDQRGRMTQIRCLVNDLRTIDQSAPQLFSDQVKVRLRKVSRYRASDVTPREPLAIKFADRLLARADASVAAARDRIDAGRRLLAELSTTTQPGERDRIRLKLLTGGRPTSRESDTLRAAGQKTGDYSRAAIMTMDDAVAFAIAIGLRVKMPIECLTDLRRDCIKRTTGKNAWIEYWKGRGGRSERIKLERVRDGGISTPGGMIRLLLRLTQPAADQLSEQGHPDAQSLWVGYVQKGSPNWRRLSLCNSAFRRTVSSWELHDETGNPITNFAPSRMRKTTKAASYRSKRGNVPRFATDHGKKVAMRHYAAVEDLAEEHARSIEAAENELLQSAMTPMVLTPEEEAAARVKGVMIGGRRIDPETYATLTNGSSDTFLGICLDFWNSPFGAEKDGSCPVPFTPCLHCRNAVFTLAKLVPLIILLIWIEDRRSIMGHDEWLAAHGLDRARIRLQILPRFSPADVEAAWTIARSSNEGPVLPPHWKHT